MLGTDEVKPEAQERTSAGHRPPGTATTNAHVPIPARSGGPSAPARSGQTPSLNAILEAYARDGAGDRELLLALLRAKQTEDERLAAMDCLWAEHLRAQALACSYHLSLWGYAGHRAAPTAYPAPSSASPAPSSLGTSRSRASSITTESVSDDPAAAGSPAAPAAPVPTTTAGSSAGGGKRRRGAAAEGDREVTRAEALRALRRKLARITPRPSSSSSPPPPQSQGTEVLPSAVEHERRAKAGRQEVEAPPMGPGEDGRARL